MTQARLFSEQYKICNLHYQTILELTQYIKELLASLQISRSIILIANSLG